MKRGLRSPISPVIAVALLFAAATYVVLDLLLVTPNEAKIRVDKAACSANGVELLEYEKAVDTSTAASFAATAPGGIAFRGGQCFKTHSFASSPEYLDSARYPILCSSPDGGWAVRQFVRPRSYLEPSARVLLATDRAGHYVFYDYDGAGFNFLAPQDCI
jgi:hypothetical protein